MTQYLTDAYVFPGFQVALVALWLYAVVRSSRVFHRRSRASDTFGSSLTSGETSRAVLHLAYGLLSVILLQIINAAEALKGYKTAISIVDLAILAYLVYLNAWAQNRIVFLALWWRVRPG